MKKLDVDKVITEAQNFLQKEICDKHQFCQGCEGKNERNCDFYFLEKFLKDNHIIFVDEKSFCELEEKNEIVKQFYEIQNARKETEKEVLQEIWDEATEYDEYYDTEDETEYANIEWVGLSRDDFLKICKERGVEVE